MKYSNRRQVSVAGLGLLSMLSMQSAGAYSEDMPPLDSYDHSVSGGHSTFHYELVRTLAAAAGYTERNTLGVMDSKGELLNDASLIAEASHATDTFPSEMLATSRCEALTSGEARHPVTGQTLINDTENLYVVGTLRSKDESVAQTAFYHWPRRQAVSPVTEYHYRHTDQIEAGTCDYFSNLQELPEKNDLCRANTVNFQAELNSMESWVFNADEAALLSNNGITTPCFAATGETFSYVPAGSVISLGIYLHSLGDSYSHQACMKINKTRSHTPLEDEGRRLQAHECNSIIWHTQEEYGVDAGDPELPDMGVEYTKAAAMATWDALKLYSQLRPYATGNVLNESEVITFVNAFSLQESQQVRSCIASTFYQRILQGDNRYSDAILRACKTILQT